MCEFEVDEYFLFVEAFCGVQADDDVPLELADVERVSVRVGGRRFPGGTVVVVVVVVVAGAVDGYADGSCGQESAWTFEFELYVGSVALEQDDASDPLGEEWEREVGSLGQACDVRLDGLGDAAVVERLGEQVVGVCLLVDGRLDSERADERLVLVRSEPEIGLQTRRAQLQSSHRNYVALLSCAHSALFPCREQRR